MKRFIDEKGTFETKIPATWKHSITKGKIHTFNEYEIWKSDSFQISINLLDTVEKRNNFQKLIKSLTVEKIGDEDFYKFSDLTDLDFTTKAWIKQFGNKTVIFSLTYSNNVDKELDKRTVDEKIQIAKSILKEFKLIDDADYVGILKNYRFDMFLQGVGATALILSRAVDNKAFIEATCILGNQIDALLRIGIILKNQIINNNNEIELEWIYHGQTDKKKSEKEIYKKALDLGIIEQKVFDELFKLYDDRNRVIHRFIISEITLAEVEEIAFKYYKKQQEITKLIYDIESHQIKLGVGMTIIDSNKQNEQNHLEYIKGKIGKQNYFDKKN